MVMNVVYASNSFLSGVNLGCQKNIKINAKEGITSLYLNDNDKLLVPTKENLLDYCLMRSPNGRNRFILYLKHDIQLIQGERVCVRCWKHMKDVEAALETREKKVSG